MKWTIETSFRTLKYVLGLTNFHSKKVDCIIQEIFACLTMFHLYETRVTSVVVEQPKAAKHIYKINVTMAFQICQKFFMRMITNPPNLEALIKKYILPVRDERNYPRKVRDHSVISFLYRVS